MRYRKEYDLAEFDLLVDTHKPGIQRAERRAASAALRSLLGFSAAGDKLMIGGGGEPTLLAGLSAQPSSGEAVLASCFDGRVIIQTFCNHDYRESDIIPLWQNYIHYTLKNHFAALTP